MSARRGRPHFRPATHRIWRHNYATQDDLVAAVGEHTLAGDIVRICRRHGFETYDVVLNQSLFLVRDADGTPIGSYQTIRQALAAGDSAVEQDDAAPDGAA